MAYSFLNRTDYYMKNLLFLLTLLGFSFITAQTDSLANSGGIDVSRLYNEQELDSLIIVSLGYYQNGDFDELLVKLPILIQNAKDIESEFLESRYINFLGNILIKVGDKENAVNYFEESLKKSIERNDSIGISKMYISLGNVYLENEPEKALTYYQQSLDYISNIPIESPTAFVTHHNLAQLYGNESETTKARYHLNLIIDKVDSQEPYELKMLFKGTLKCIEATIDLAEKDYHRAIENSKQSLQYKQYFEPNYELNNYGTLIDAYAGLDQYKESLYYYEKYDSLKDNQYEESRILAEQKALASIEINKIEEKLKIAEQENELATQKAGFNKIIMIIFIFLTLLLLTAALLLFREKTKRDTLLTEVRTKNNEYLLAKNESEELARKNTRFLSTISHELRTPLYGIVGLSSAFLKDHRLKDFQGDLSSLKFSADYLLALVNDVLNINKFSSINGQEITESHFEIHRLLRNIKQSFTFLNEKHNNKVTIVIDPKTPDVLYADYTKVSQVLMNLLSNASKFTEDGTIVLAINLVEELDKEVILKFEIKDTGRGIHPDDQKRILEEFMQIKGNNDFEIAGTGLGIPIVTKILHLLESELHIDSELNKGSTFFFNLKIQKGNSEFIKKEIENEQLSSLKGRSVLIVDDNKINQLVTKKVIEIHHMSHKVASNGKQAVEMNKDFDFDFILMDINMPVMDGVEATRRIREYDTETPIIALTATNFEDPEKEIYSHGFNAIVVKPYNNEHLIQAFTQQLALKNSQ